MMLKLFKTIFDAGEPTVRYPFAPLPVSPGFRGKPEFTAEQCIACAACTVACPPNALTMHTDADAGTREWSLFLGRCIFCGRCEEVCPTKAIVLSEEFEMAVASKKDLYQRATFTLTKCRVCEQAFAPAKEIDYVIALLVQSGTPVEHAEAQRTHLETCPECKRKQSIPHAANVSLSQHMHEGMVK